MNEIRYSYYPKPYNILYKDKNFEAEMPFHMHNEFEITLCIEGAESVIAGNKIYHAGEKSLFFFPTNCMHKININKNFSYKRYIMTISPTWLKSILGRDNKLRINSIMPCVTSLSDDDFFELKGIFENYIKYEYDELKRLSILFSVLDICESLLNDENKFDISPISDIMQYINNNLNKELKVSDIAERFFFNPDYLCRLFKKHTNITVNEYINIQRISVAREMLDSGSAIKTVQDKTGFNNYSHFSRTFKKFYNLTPKQYQNRKYYFDTVN